MKKLLIGFVVLVLVGVGGYFYLNSRGAVPSLPGTMTGNNSIDGNIFTSIKDAMSKSMSLKCDYRDEEGVETTTYIKGGLVRVMMTAEPESDEPNNIIMRENKMYMWSDMTKTGFVFEINDPDISPYPTLAEQEYDQESAPGQEESVLATIEKYKDACKAEVVSEAMFEVPDDVTFQDMSEFTKNIQQQTPPNTANQAEYEKYLKDLMQQQGE